MSVAAQTAFVGALHTAATANGATNTYEGVAPSSARVPYVVYVLAGNAGPQRGLYGGGYDESDVYLVSCVAATHLAAETLSDAIGEALHGANPNGVISVRRENRAPTPPPQPDQVRYVAAVYYRVRYTGGD